MRQVLRKGIKEIVVREVPDPIVAPHHVVVHPLYSLISSGTETASIHQEGVLKEVADNPSHLRKVWEVTKVNGPVRTLAEVKAKFEEYAVLGYSGAGVIVSKHPTVRDLETGDRVAYGGEGTGHGDLVMTGRNLVARVPDNVGFDHACFATLGSIALNAVRIANVGIGDKVAVIGLGLVGQLVAQLVRLQGAVVIGTDLRPDRVALARSLGAEHAFAGAAPQEAIAAVTEGRGADCVIVAAAAKSAGPCQTALQICRDRGRIVVVGAVEMSFSWNDMYLKEIQLFMSRAYGPGSYDAAYEKGGQDYPFSYVPWTENRNMEEFLRLLSTGQVSVEPLVTHTFPLEQAPQAYRTIMDPAGVSLAVRLMYEEIGVADYQMKHTVSVGVGRKPADTELGVALIGSGNLARWAHLPALQKIRGAELRAVHSSSGARGLTYASRFGAAYCTTDIYRILSDPQIHAVLIVTRNQYHARQAIAALGAGKHVFVEKPMALTEEECRDILTAVQTSGRQLTVGFNRRFAPEYAAVKARLAARTGPAVLNCRVNSPGISGAYWMADPAIGGAVLGEACHFVDLMYWLLDSEPVAVSAFSLPAVQREPIGQNNLAATFRFADGSVGCFTYSTVGSRSSGGERLEAFTPGLGISTENFKSLTVQTRWQRTRRRWFAEKGYEKQLVSFIESVRTGKEPEVTARDGVRATIGCLRMLESARDLVTAPISFDDLIGT